MVAPRNYYRTRFWRSAAALARSSAPSLRWRPVTIRECRASPGKRAPKSLVGDGSRDRHRRILHAENVRSAAMPLGSFAALALPALFLEKRYGDMPEEHGLAAFRTLGRVNPPSRMVVVRRDG